MTYTTLMVHLELEHSNAARLQIAGDLAAYFQAGVIGIAACQPLLIIYSEGFVSRDLIELDREETATKIRKAEAEFRRALETRVETLEWLSLVRLAPLSEYLARGARSANLVITGVVSGVPMLEASRSVNTGDLVMQVAAPGTGDDATQLNVIAQEQGADLMVAGAYGHSRLREWAFGGVTRDLLLRADRCSLVSH